MLFGTSQAILSVAPSFNGSISDLAIWETALDDAAAKFFSRGGLSIVVSEFERRQTIRERVHSILFEPKRIPAGVHLHSR